MKKYKNSKAITIPVLAVSFFISLCLLGFLGEFGSAISDFFIGFFGLAVYAYALSTVAVCIILLCGGQMFIKGKALAKYLLLLSALILTLHTATSKDFFTNGFFAYLVDCYASASTAGGMLFGILAYLPAQLISYTGALIVFCLLFLACALLALTKNKVTSGNYRSKKVVYGSAGTLTEFKTNVDASEKKSVGDSLYIATIGSKKDSKIVRTKETPDNYIHYEPIDSIFGANLQGEGILSDTANEEEEVIAPVLEADAKQTAYDKLFNFQKTYSPSTIDDDTTAIVDKGSASEKLFSSTYTPKTTSYDSAERSVSFYPEKKEEVKSEPEVVKSEKTQEEKDKEQRDAFFNFAFSSDPRKFTNAYFNSSKTEESDDEIDEPQTQTKNSYSGISLDFTPSESYEYDDRLSSVLYSLDSETEAEKEESVIETPKTVEKMEEKAFSDVEDTFDSLFSSKTVEKVEEKFDDDFFESEQVVDEPKSAFDTLFSDNTAKEQSVSEFFGEDDDVVAEDLFSTSSDEDIVSEEVENDKEEVSVVTPKPIEPVIEEKPIAVPLKRDFSAIENGNFNQKKKTEQKGKVLPGQISLTEETVEPKRRPYVAPPLELLSVDNVGGELQGEDHEQNKKNLEEILVNFKVDGHVSGIVVGPTFTRYEINLSPGVSVKKILNIADDIAVGLGGKKIRIEAPVPGKTCVGIEIPNTKRQSVGLRGVLERSNFFTSKSPLTVCLGRNISGDNITCNLADMPHLLVAGTTGAGKSVSLNVMLCSLLYKSSPEDLRLILVDPKRVELNRYNGLPHMLIKNAITDAPKVIRAMDWLISEMDNRYELFSKCGVNNIIGYNAKVLQSGQGKKLPYILMVIDEIGDLMLLVKNDIEDRIQRLAQLARAAGIHLIVATQRPDVNVITGTIKANLPSRIAFAVTTTGDSMTILGVGGAEKLLGKGDMLFSSRTAPEPARIQCAFLQDDEADAVTNFVREKNDAFFDENIEKAIATAPQEGNVVGPDGQDEVDALFWEAVEFAISQGNISVTAIQRRFRLGFSRAGRIIDQMYERNFIAKSEGAKAREVLITQEQYNELMAGGGEPTDEE